MKEKKSFKRIVALILVVSAIIGGCTLNDGKVHLLDQYDSSFDPFDYRSEIDISFEHNSVSGSSSDSIDVADDNYTEEDIDLVSETIDLQSNKALCVYSRDGYLTQGMCSYEDGFFLSQRNASIIEDYHIFKIEYKDKIKISGTRSTYNHANGMAYNSAKKELYICKLSSSSSTTGCDRLCDFSFFVVDSLSFEIKQEIDLFDIVQSVCPDCIGISGIAFNNKTRKCYVLTRKPKRYIIALNEDFTFHSSFFICEDRDDVLFGDISSFDDYVVTCYWNMGESSLSNIVSFYDSKWRLVRVVELFGMTHIESIDKMNGRLIANFNDFSVGDDTKVFSIDLL